MHIRHWKMDKGLFKCGGDTFKLPEMYFLQQKSQTGNSRDTVIECVHLLQYEVEPEVNRVAIFHIM